MRAMKRTSRLAVLLCTLAIVLANTSARAQGQSVVLRNVTVIDGTGAAPQAGMSVVITGNRIVEIGRMPRVPAQAQVVDGTGKYVIPGLWDMHLHLRGDARVPRYNTFGEVLLIAHGVTGARVMAGLPQFHRIKRSNESGETIGPRIEISGRNMDGLLPKQPLPPKWGDVSAEAEEWQSVGTGEIPRAYQITNAAQARTAVAEAKASGVEFLKIHNELTPEAYFAIAAEARANGLYLTGHVPAGVTVAALSDSGMRSIEHWGGMLEGCSSREDEIVKAQLAAASLPAPERARRTTELRRMAVDSFDARRCAALAARLVKNGTWLSPTFMPEGGMRASADRNADLAKYVFAPLRARWQQQAAAAPAPPAPTPEARELAERIEARNHEIVAVMKKGGVQFVIGTDSGGPWRIPGRSLHEGLIETAKAGLTPMDLIVAATSSSAKLVKRDAQVGTVQAGRLADLVVLDANPLQNIANTQRINAVVVNGRLLDRATLDATLAQLASAQAGPASQ
jgi:imidazolonepropionase-like amidohydrolase